MDEAPNRLNAAIARLEEAVKSRVEQPLRHLREAIEYQRSQGGFDEGFIVMEIEHIAHRDRLEWRRYFAVGEEIQHLADRIMMNGPQREKP
jgi:hypothetical protein